MKKLFTLFSVCLMLVIPLQAQCDLDFASINTGSNMTAFFTPNAASSIFSNLGEGQIGSFYLDEEGAFVCASSAIFNGDQLQLAVMGNDATTPTKDGFSSGETINWFYQTNSGSVYALGLIPVDAFVINAMTFITSATYSEVDCGGTSTNDECPALETDFLNTGSNMTLFVTSGSLLSDLGNGTVGVYFMDDNGIEVCGGASAFSGGQVQIAAMGNDATTTEKDGFSAGEVIIWKFESNDGSQYNLTPSPQDVFTLNATSFVIGMTNDAISCSVDLEGCTDAMYLEFNASANTDDGSCATFIIEGCTDSNYVEYNSNANVDDGSCVTVSLDGCTDASACNFNLDATTDDGSCYNNDLGCGCDTPAADDGYDCDGDCLADADNDDVCDGFEVAGCQDASADNYNADATDSGYCEYSGCTDSAYLEYDETANTENGSCTTLIVGGCTDSNATNFDSSANTSDGSCEYDLIGDGCDVNFETINTGNNHTVFLTPGAVDVTPLSSGDDIGVFYISEDGSAQCAGSSIWNGDQLQITVFGDDATTDEIDGFTSGATLLLLAQSGDDVYIVSASYQTPSMSTFTVNGISFVVGLDFESACTVEYLGCTDVNACNYNASANTNDNSCDFASDNYDCNEVCLNDVDEDGVCDELEIFGCTDFLYSNYNSLATEDNNSCVSWEDAYGSCVESGGDDGITQADLDAVQALLDAVVPEDGITQGDVDAVQALLDAIVPEDGVSQADVDAAYLDGAASVTPEDGITQVNLDAIQLTLNSTNTQLLASQSDVAELQVQLEEALANSGGSCDPIYVDLLSGWNIIGYTLPFQQDVVATLASIVDDVLIVKDNSANVYWPQYGFNGIGDFIPGQGYQINMVDVISDFTFPNVDGQRIELTPTVPNYVYDLPVLTHPNDIRTLVKVVNMLGQEVNPDEQFKGELVLYLFNDGTTEKRLVE